jgi:hypothetical protein
MFYVGFEPTIPASERVKTVHALDRSATVTGMEWLVDNKFEMMWKDAVVDTFSVISHHLPGRTEENRVKSPS